MNSFRLGSVLGFEIRIDYSWFVIFFLILWSLSAGYFPSAVPGLSWGVYAAMGVAGTLLFFGSLLAHELSHSVVARSKGIPVDGITLFIFGGMAHTRMESEEPGDELLIASVGPVMSLVLAAMFFGAAWIGIQSGWGRPVTSVLSYLSFINFLLAAFNLLPGFPLDGGRLFRAAVWKATGDLTKATRWAAAGGRSLGYLLMVFGFFQLFAGAVLGGVWLVFIGWFLKSAADSTLQQHMLGRVLEGVTAREVMSGDPDIVPPQLTVQELVDDHIMRRRDETFPVVDHGRLAGLVTLEQVKRAPRNRWPGTTVAEIMTPGGEGEQVVVRPEEPVSEVLTRLQTSGSRRALVMRDHELMGTISGNDITAWARRARELGELEGSPGV